MPIEILMPALSPTMTEGNLAKWLKKEGDKIKPGDVIAEIETDKATMEVESIDEGILGKILVAEGTENVKVNSLMALILEDGESVDVLKDYIPLALIQDNSNTEVKSEKTEEKKDIQIKDNIILSDQNNRIFASPLAKRIAKDESVDLRNIAGSGPHGRIIKDDVLKNIGNKNTSTMMVGRNPEEYKKIPNNNIRKVIAKRLVESKQTIPHFYLNVECCLDSLLLVRQELNCKAEEGKSNYKLSVNDFMIKAVACALKDVPQANSSWSDEAILQYNNIDISVAVAIDGGLITPIIRNADQKSIIAISNEMKELAHKARNNALKPEEFQGGGFSISNLGMYGVKKFSAIVNPPQGCILAIGAGEKRAIVRENNIIIANMVDITLSCDHRVVDGAVGAKFLSVLKRYLESPVLMFI
jgi:pyruvate dehydrogenase E2 component (dihydrolipoamide acetyltransferase)